jgi:hypothetical protein
MTMLCVNPFGRMRQERDTAQMCQVQSGYARSQRNRGTPEGGGLQRQS